MQFCLRDFISDESVNLHSRKIHARKQISAFHKVNISLWFYVVNFRLCWFHVISAISREITLKLTGFSLANHKNSENCHSQVMHFTQIVKSEIVFL